jgi:hypothetical protein
MSGANIQMAALSAVARIDNSSIIPVLTVKTCSSVSGAIVTATSLLYLASYPAC